MTLAAATAALGQPVARALARSGETVLNYDGVTLNFSTADERLQQLTFFLPAEVHFRGILVFTAASSFPGLIEKIAPGQLLVNRWGTVIAPSLCIYFSGFHQEEDEGMVFGLFDPSIYWLDRSQFQRFTQRES
jgi:hypothetical protein